MTQRSSYWYVIRTPKYWNKSAVPNNLKKNVRRIGQKYLVKIVMVMCTIDEKDTYVVVVQEWRNVLSGCFIGFSAKQP